MVAQGCPAKTEGKFEVTETSALLAAMLETHLLRFGSVHTRRAYQLDWEQFCAEVKPFCSAQTLTPADLTEDLMLAWFHARDRSVRDEGPRDSRGRAARVASWRRLIAFLSGFFHFLVRKGVLAGNPVGILPRLPGPIDPHDRTEALTQAEMALVLENVSLEADAVRQRAQALASGKDRRLCSLAERTASSRELTEAVIWTLLTVGMRVGELCSLRIIDVRKDSSGVTLSMSLKGGESHEPYIHPLAAARIEKYMRTHRSAAAGDEPLFIRAQKSANPRPLTQSAVFQMVQRVVASCGISRRLSPHSLRASLATALIQQNIPVGQVKDLLGHQSIRTTNVYVKRAHALEEAAALQLDTAQLFNSDEQLLKVIEGQNAQGKNRT